MNLRPLALHEHAVVVDWALHEGWPGRTKESTLDAEEFAQIVAQPDHRSFCIAEPDGPALGFGQIWTSAAGVVSLVRIVVDPALRGRGIGKRLSALLLAQARVSAGDRGVRLRVRRDNQRAMAIYEALGFRVIEAESNEVACAMRAE